MTLTPMSTSLIPPAVARTQQLMDIYGPVLTERQREVCRLHFDEDFSLAEIASTLGCTRSAVHDSLQRGVAQLEEFETALGLAARIEKLETQVEDLQGTSGTVSERTADV